MFCNKCGQKLPDDSLFCQYCGAKIEQQKISTVQKIDPETLPKVKKKIGKKGISLIALGILFVSLAAVFFGYFNSYNKAIEYACVAKFVEANDVLWFPSVTEKHDPELIKCLRIGENLDKKTLSTFRTLKNMATDGNRYAKDALVETQDIIYKKALKLIKQEDYANAYDLLVVLNDYKESNKYYLLCVAKENRWNDDEYRQIIKNLNFKDMKTVVVSYPAIADRFLTGTWKTSDGEYYFKITDEGASYNLPRLELKGSHYNISDGVYYLYTGSFIGQYMGKEDEYKTKKVFRFTVKDADTVNVHCYKNGKTYTLYRQ